MGLTIFPAPENAQEWVDFTLGLPSGEPKGTDIVSFIDFDEAQVAEATGTAADPGTPDSVITVGTKTYTVVASGATGDQINAGASANDFADNIATKVTADTADTLCTCVDTTGDLVFTANDAGAAGNSIPISTDDPGLTLGAFEGGTDDTYTLKQSTVTDLLAA